MGGMDARARTRRSKSGRGALCCALALAASCNALRSDETEREPEAISLLGRPLYAPELGPERRARLEADLAWALARRAAEPEGEETTIWVGRRLGYLGRYREAIDVFSGGLSRHPRSAGLLRHRGHRYITVRELDAAVRDLSLAAELMRGLPDEVEADGAPNALGIPTGTTHGNIWYHLGLARYLQGDFERALDAWRECLETSTNDDMLCATSYWQYLTLRQLDQPARARAALLPIHAHMNVIENFAYRRLLLFYKGELYESELLEGVEAGTVDWPTTMYGLGAWHLLEGRSERARDIFRKIVAGDVWAAFGHVAAEAALARMKRAS